MGSSDVAAILNVSPWKTKYELWLEKTKKQEPAFKGNSATQRGQDLEAKARALYELHKEIEMPPALIVSDEYDYMRVSLDGWNKEHNRIIEIKCPGKPVIELAKCGKAPEYYMIQIQYQLMLSGAEVCDYVVFDGKEIIITEVKPDHEKQVLLYKEVVDFWDSVIRDIPPPLSDKDYKEFDDIKVLTYLAELNELIQNKKALEDKEKILREKVVSKMDHPRMFGSGIKVIKIERAGTVDWKKVEKEYGVDPEKYRKKPIISYQFRLDQGESNDE